MNGLSVFISVYHRVIRFIIRMNLNIHERGYQGYHYIRVPQAVAMREPERDPNIEGYHRVITGLSGLSGLSQGYHKVIRAIRVV